jgi:hypothetical protein
MWAARVHALKPQGLLPLGTRPCDAGQEAAARNALPLRSVAAALCSAAGLAGLSSVPQEIGALSRLEGLQLEGCPLAAPLGALYRKDPLLLVAVHNPRTSELDLSEVGIGRTHVRSYVENLWRAEIE